MNADARLAAAFLGSHPADATAVLEQAGAEASALLLGDLAPEVIAATLQQMAPAEAAAVLGRLPRRTQLESLSGVAPGAGARILRSVAREERKQLLAAAPQTTARALRLALEHFEESAGSMMDTNVIALSSEASVGEARRRVRRRSGRTGNYLYLVDGHRRLVGAVAFSRLISASPTVVLGTLMQSAVVSIPVQAGELQILNHEGWRELHAIPVVDAEGVLVGILRRETYERLREERSDVGGERVGGVGMAFAELVWTAMLSTVDGVGGALRHEAVEARRGVRDDG